MATNIVDKNTCSVCLNTFNEPKLIDCHHTFCLGCLQDYAKKFTCGTFPCPLCRRQISIPTGGINSFSPNFYINDTNATNTAVTVPVLDFCIHHANKPAELYCTQCCDAVCSKCFTVKHNGHVFLDLESESTMTEAKEQSVCLEKQFTTYEKDLQSVADSLKVHNFELNASTKIAQDKIEASVQKICSDAKRLGEQLSATITSLSETEQSELDKVKVQLEQQSSDLKSAQKLSEEISSNVSVMQVLNKLKLYKDIAKNPATFNLPTIPNTRFPFFDEDGTTIVLIGKCKTTEETDFNSTFSLKDLIEDEKIYCPYTTAIESLSWCSAARCNTDTSKLDLFINLNLPGNEELQSCYARFSITLVSSVDENTKTVKGDHEFTKCGKSCGWSFIDWDMVVDPDNGYLDKNNKLVVSTKLQINHIKRKDNVP